MWSDIARPLAGFLGVAEADMPSFEEISISYYIERPFLVRLKPDSTIPIDQFQNRGGYVRIERLDALHQPRSLRNVLQRTEERVEGLRKKCSTCFEKDERKKEKEKYIKEIDGVRSKITSSQKENNELTERLENIDKMLAAQGAILAKQGDTIAKQGTIIAKLQTDIAEQAAVIANQAIIIANHATIIANQETVIAKLVADSAGHATSLEALRQQLNTVQEEIEHIRIYNLVTEVLTLARKKVVASVYPGHSTDQYQNLWSAEPARCEAKWKELYSREWCMFDRLVGIRALRNFEVHSIPTKARELIANTSILSDQDRTLLMALLPEYIYRYLA
ncbi:hypothetical protein Pelo_10899 [Pelomyxa schiedti]|nr:hypothetical protein Pelo_10899 [Pelomyxa schiedti]